MADAGRADPVRPDDWERRGWGRVHNASNRVWAVSVGGSVSDPYQRILGRIRSVVARVDERRDVYPMKRGVGSLPLLAVPVVGIGYGGYGGQMGDVLLELVRYLTDCASEFRVDIALVTPDPAVYAAAQYSRRPHLRELPDRLEQLARELAEQVKGGHLALLLGAGVSAAAGLPTWHRLIKTLASEFDVEGWDDPRANLTATDQAELIELSAQGRFQERVAAIASSAERPSLLHAVLAGLDCHAVVTTNYDLLCTSPPTRGPGARGPASAPSPSPSSSVSNWSGSVTNVVSRLRARHPIVSCRSLGPSPSRSPFLAATTPLSRSLHTLTRPGT